MRKKVILGIVSSVYLMGMLAISGCGSEPAEETTGDIRQDSSQTAEQAQTGYVFETKGVKISVDMDMSLVQEELGEPDSYFEQPSCAAQGTARIFTYSSFEIDTYPDGEKDLVGSIILKDDNVATAEGVDLSMTKENLRPMSV